jgi:2-C-methyl-D-erythritol 4-phosphate cytidylyltransferase
LRTVNAGLILAGGKSERIPGLSVPKQYCSPNGRPLIAYSLRAFQSCDAIFGIVVVADEAWRPFVSDLIGREEITKFLGFADPGATRQASVYSGLLAPEHRMREDDIVVVHDAARPMVTEKLIRECIEEASRRDGATPALRVSDTIYKSADGRSVCALLNREELFAGQTPEAYRFGKYLAAHRALSEAELSRIRGGSEIAFGFGMDIGLIQGDENNFKITTAADLERFRLLSESASDAGKDTHSAAALTGGPSAGGKRGRRGQ